MLFGPDSNVVTVVLLKEDQCGLSWNYMAKSMWIADYHTMLAFLKLLPWSLKHIIEQEVFVHSSITIFFHWSPKPVPVWLCTCVQGEGHKNMICQRWSGRTPVAFTKPWFQAHWTPFGWTKMVTVHQDSLLTSFPHCNISTRHHQGSCGCRGKSPQPHSKI